MRKKPCTSAFPPVDGRYCHFHFTVNKNQETSLHIYLLSIHDVQSLLQGTETLALKVVDMRNRNANGNLDSCRLSLELANESLIAILNGYGVAAFCVGRDVDIEGDDSAGVDGFLVNGLA